MLQDDCHDLSRWLSTRPGARRQAEEVAEEIEAERLKNFATPACANTGASKENLPGLSTSPPGVGLRGGAFYNEAA